MAAPKSFLKKLSVTTAKRRHSCQHNAAHVITAGDKRLTVRIDRTDEHFCVACGSTFLQRDMGLLDERLQELTAPAAEHS
jgi:hypothetical protein